MNLGQLAFKDLFLELISELFIAVVAIKLINQLFGNYWRLIVITEKTLPNFNVQILECGFFYCRLGFTYDGNICASCLLRIVSTKFEGDEIYQGK